MAEGTSLADAAALAALRPLSDQLREREHRDRVWRRWITALFLLALLALGILVDSALVNRRNGQRIVECTTAGPRRPTPADPSTGHRCYDEGQQRTNRAVAAIVDTDGNGVPDITDLRRDLGLPVQPPP